MNFGITITAKRGAGFDFDQPIFRVFLELDQYPPPLPGAYMGDNRANARVAREGGAMGGLEIAVSIAGFAVIAAIGVFIVAWLVPARNSRLMRCPETGAVTYVDTTTTARGEDAAEVTVRWCELWPQRKDCARTCLARYPQASPGYRIDVKALRPFDRQ